MSCTATLESSWRCVVPASAAGVRMAMAQVMGALSMEAHSTPSANLTTIMPAFVMASLLAWGMAKPPVMPVVPSASRALKAS